MKPARRAAVWILIAAAVLCPAAALIPRGSVPAGGQVFRARGIEDAPLAEIPFPDGTVDINTDDPLELTVLPGIGEVLAQRIIDERLANGEYFFPEDLLAVRGIGASTLARIRDMLDFSRSGD